MPLTRHWPSAFFLWSMVCCSLDADGDVWRGKGRRGGEENPINGEHSISSTTFTSTMCSALTILNQCQADAFVARLPRLPPSSSSFSMRCMAFSLSPQGKRMRRQLLGKQASSDALSSLELPTPSHRRATARGVLDCDCSSPHHGGFAAIGLHDEGLHWAFRALA